MKKGQTGVYRNSLGRATTAVVCRARGGNQVDLDVDGEHLQMVDLGTAAGCFEPHGHDSEDIPPRSLPARLVPRYIPVWHAVVLGIPVAAGTAVLTVLAWLRWLN